MLHLLWVSTILFLIAALLIAGALILVRIISPRLYSTTHKKELSLFHDTENTGLFVADLNAPAEEVVLLAARILAESQQPDIFPRIIESLQRFPTVSPLLLADIMQRFNRGTFPLLTTTALENTNRAIRIAAIQALVTTGGVEAVEPLIALCQDNDASIRAASFTALGHIGDNTAAALLPAGLHDPSWQVRKEAAFCAGRIRATHAIPVLEGLMNDPIWQVRIQAEQALFMLEMPSLPVLHDVYKPDKIYVP